LPEIPDILKLYIPHIIINRVFRFIRINSRGIRSVQTQVLRIAVGLHLHGVISVI
jgi:hypothetical protein